MPRKDSLMQVCGDLLGSYAADGVEYPAILVTDLVYINSARRVEESASTTGASGSTTCITTPQYHKVLDNALQKGWEVPSDKVRKPHTQRSQFGACFSRIIFDEAHYFKTPGSYAMAFVRSLNTAFTSPGPQGTPSNGDQQYLILSLLSQ